MTQIAREPATGTEKLTLEVSHELAQRLADLAEVKGQSQADYAVTVLYEFARRRRPR